MIELFIIFTLCLCGVILLAFSICAVFLVAILVREEWQDHVRRYGK